MINADQEPLPQTMEAGESDDDDLQEEGDGEGDSASPSSSEESEDDEVGDAEAEAALEREAESLRRHLAANPYHYDSHVRLIQLLRQAGDLEGSRVARERMHAQYPLSPQLWLDWIGDERRLLTEGEAATPQQAEALDGLFRRALDDYASVDVAAEYCVFAIGQQKLLRQQRGGEDDKENSGDAPRRVFEHCAALVGRFAGRGDQRVWEAWRDFELLELARLQAVSAVGAASAEAAVAAAAAIEKQRRLVLDVFRRHLGTPHLGLEATWKELLDWLGGEEAGGSALPPAELLQAYERSCAELRVIQPFEERLASEPENLAQNYRDYIAAACGGPAQQLAVYERAVTANCLDSGLWESYAAYVWEQFEPGPKLRRLCQRAVRNCPWAGALWRQLALCQECAGGAFATEVAPTFEAAVSAGLTDPADLLAVWLAYLDAARRQAVRDLYSWEDWHRLCERGLVAMDAAPLPGDAQASLLRYAAMMRASRGELGPARQIWDQVMKRGHGNSAQMWLRQLDFELRFGDAKHVRRCFGRAVNSVSNAAECEDLLRRLLDYEREEGDVSSYVEAVKRAEKQRRTLLQRAGAERGGGSSGGGGSGGVKRKAPAEQERGAKRPRQQQQLQDQQQPAREFKHPQNQQPPGHSAGSEFKKPLPPPQSSKVGSAGAGAAAAVTATRGESVDHDPNKDYRTVFLSNLAYDVDEAAVRAAFGPRAADIANLRLVRDYRGRSKGFAYAEFASGAAANAAIKMDRTPINGRPMFVSECRGGGGGGREAADKLGGSQHREFQYEVGLERNKLFVRNLPRAMDQAAFETMCSARQGFRTARLAVFRSGASKGHGYAEFADANAAAAALEALNGVQVGGQQLEVAISNPPARRTLGGDDGGGGGGYRQQRRPGFAAPAAASAGPATDPNRHRTKIALVPRQLKAPSLPAASAASTFSKGGSGGGSGGNVGGGAGGGMSNDDFRNLVLRK